MQNNTTTIMMLVNNLAQGKWQHPKLIAKRIEDLLCDKVEVPTEESNKHN